MITLGVLAALCALLVVYPYVVYPLLLRCLPAKPVEPGESEARSVSLLFCAFNEGAALADKLANIEVLRTRYPSLEVLAYNDASDDDTLARLVERSDIVTTVDGDGRRGKAHGMKVLTGRATGDILVFTDANVTLDVEAIDNLLRWYQDPEVGGVCGTLRYVNAHDSATASVGGAYWRLEERLKSLESRSGNVMGADGSIFSLRRELYPTFPDTVLDDLTVSMAAVFAGKRLIKVDDVVARERLVSVRRDEFSRKVRISARAFHTHLYLRPQLKQMAPVDKFKYGSRKLVRWFGGLFLVLGALLTVALLAAVSPWAGLIGLVVIVVAALAGPRIHVGPVGVLADVLLAIMATLLGVSRAVRGKTYSTWAPAKSR